MCGHFRDDCRKKKKFNDKKEQDNNQDDPKGNPLGEGMHHIFVRTESLFTTTFLNSWVVDSGSTSYIARDKKILLPCKQFQEKIDMST